MDTDTEIERLYGLSLEDFTAQRNALAKTLRSRGDKEEAAVVSGLAKPVVVAWAVNQAARRDEASFGRLLEIGRRTQEVEDAASMRTLAADKRTVITTLLGAAKAALAEAGRPASSTTRERIVQTLSALPALHSSPEVARARLSKEVEATGFEALSAGAFGALELSDPPPADEPRARASALANEAADLERAADELEAAAAEARRAAAQAETRAAEGRAAAVEARRRAERAR